MEAWDYPAGMLDTGFAIALDLSGLPPGQYGMYVHDAGGETSVCGIGFGFALQ